VKSLIIVLAFTLLAGCVGFSVDIAETKNFHISYSEPSEKLKVPNGIVKFKSDYFWCGITLWLGIPIPLRLPVCEIYFEVTYQNNIPVLLVRQDYDPVLYACGPFNWMFMDSNTEMRYEGNYLCGKF